MRTARRFVSCFSAAAVSFAAAVCTLMLAGCSTDSGSSAIGGTWLVTYAAPIQYDPDDATAQTDAQIFEFSGSDVEMIFYLDTEQVMGQRGTYTTSGDTLSLTLDEWWESSTQSWGPQSDSLDLTYSHSGDTLSITPPGGTQPVDLSRVSFTVRSDLTGTWYGTGADTGNRMELQNDGNFSYFSGGVLIQWGPWDATAAYIRSADTSAGYMGYLNPYELQSSGSTLVVDIDSGGQQTYSDTAP